MWGLLLGLGGKIGARGLIAGGGVLLLVVLLVGQSVRLGSAQRKVERLEVKVAVGQVTIARVTAERDEALAAIETQNAAIERLRVEAETAAAIGRAAAARALAAGRERRERERAPGHAEMNAWFSELFHVEQP